ncbi:MULTISPECIES: SRPBCC family protein [Rhizobium/Agrobacterium group]|uniref:SRPBCC family protein n=1 Tax=Rhizobium/Agrobacterium group TaxID=227290 RepID=UPI0022BD9304|nr:MULTISPECIES: SRPBCC family protein [Rhizobium/Agrobacterium group]MCZ7482426.1 SRPBCC family protein [Rhizobium rhizogenes]MCZ7485601.1 SRPBCC family protein [Rhizobium rhizogenes]MDA5632888.1 SRPBCC family protein [Agrobacterium sp. ST15.16.024]MDF1888756.1 SRPBCC family protein [Rhizobium rhizogenes]
MPVMQSRIIHLSVEKPWAQVYGFASDPQNMPRWAAGLGGGLKPDGNDWIADGGPLGEVRVNFAPANEFGVIDHVVTLPDGLKVYNALRVTPNGSGAEVSFTLLRLDGMTDEDFEQDASAITADLETLKSLLEAD